MSERHVAPYGSWESPITSDLIVAGTIAVGQPLIDGDDLFWIEMRPLEGGRSVIVKRDVEGRIADVTPPGFNARTRVHEYGGGDYVARNGTVYFSKYALCRLDRGSPAAAIALRPGGSHRRGA